MTIKWNTVKKIRDSQAEESNDLAIKSRNEQQSPGRFATVQRKSHNRKEIQAPDDNRETRSDRVPAAACGEGLHKNAVQRYRPMPAAGAASSSCWERRQRTQVHPGKRRHGARVERRSESLSAREKSGDREMGAVVGNAESSATPVMPNARKTRP